MLNSSNIWIKNILEYIQDRKKRRVNCVEEILTCERVKMRCILNVVYWDIPGHHLVNLNGARDPSQTHNGWWNTDTPTPEVRMLVMFGCNCSSHSDMKSLSSCNSRQCFLQIYLLAGYLHSFSFHAFIAGRNVWEPTLHGKFPHKISTFLSLICHYVTWNCIELTMSN